MKLGNTHYGLGDFKMAIENYTSAILYKPKQDYYLSRAICYQEQKQYELAIADLECIIIKSNKRGVNKDNLDHAAYNIFGLIYSDEEEKYYNINKAIECFNKALKIKIKLSVPSQ